MLVAVHGLGADGGKSYFCSRARHALHVPELDRDVAVSSNEMLTSELWEYLPGPEYLFYHVGANSAMRQHVDMHNRYVMMDFGRHVDLNLVIYNPNFAQPDMEELEELYDIVVNPGSTRKASSY